MDLGLPLTEPRVSYTLLHLSKPAIVQLQSNHQIVKGYSVQDKKGTCNSHRILIWVDERIVFLH